ncbi:MAG: hypothetical protein KF699_04395 [Phycisphaeraceae bacterium]|nr:hypothetical protein [Phycisphaeraceae bacterium]
MLGASRTRWPPGVLRSNSAGAAARAVRALPWLLVAAAWAWCAGSASAQTVTFEREIVYTRSGVPAGQATLRRAVLRFAPGPTPTLTATGVGDVGASPLLFGAAGLCAAPDGDLLVAGGASAPNAVYKVRPDTGAMVAFSPGAGSPTALRIAIEPTGERALAVCTAGGTTRIARIPLNPAANGTVSPVSGADTTVTALAFGYGRAYYVHENAGVLGTINTETLVTTRILTGLDRPRAVVLDPLTGRLMVFGAMRVYQVDARPGVAPVVESEADLSGLAPWFSVAGASIDGHGRAVMLSLTGHVAVIDYRATRAIGASTNPRAAAILETAGTLAGLAPLCGAGSVRGGACAWDNGPFDLRDGLASRNSPMHGDARTADDFYLPPGIHRVDSIGATMFTDAIALTGLIEVYDDCNGLPGALVGSFAATGSDTGQTFQGLRIVRLSATTPGLWLRGGRTYWVSPVGIGNLQGIDNWYWGTSSGPETGGQMPEVPTVRGSAGAFRSAASGFAEWVDAQTAGCQCTDFAFVVMGESCKVLHDNGPPVDAPPQPPTGAMVAPGAPSIISSTNTDARAADNFRVPPCIEDDGVYLCYIEATVYTNCVPVRGTVEVFDNDCVLPLSPPIFSGAITRAVPLNYSVWIGGAALPAYRVLVEDPGWFLPAGRNYWVSVAVQGSGSFLQRAYFAGNAPRCADQPGCAIRISQAAVRGQAVNSPGWTLIEQFAQVPLDLSFLIAMKDPNAHATSGGGTISNPPRCIADADGDGTVSVADIFHFLSRWFAGCP